jgi:LAO/AO transport system kinase
VQQKPLTAKDYINGIIKKDRVLLSKAITIIESSRPEDDAMADEIIKGCLAAKKISRRIAVTGSPGAGKSTFLNAFGKLLADSQQSFAVLAIDPSSTVSKGSILGDKTRMDDIVNHENVYIRPTASSANLGGVGRSTRETILLCEAFGFDYIFIETVGVGQSETLVKNMTDLFLLLLLPNAGDELQGIKRGIMEMADIVLINKSDKENSTAAKTAAAQVKLALHLHSNNAKDWTAQVLNISSIQKTGLEELKNAVDSYFLKMETSGYLLHNREQQQQQWLEEATLVLLRDYIRRDKQLNAYKEELEEQIKNGKIAPNSAAKLLVERSVKKNDHFTS